jgi:hypothetical protein
MKMIEEDQFDAEDRMSGEKSMAPRTVNIIRNDRGLDGKRIQALIEMFNNLRRNLSRRISKTIENKREELRQQLFEEYGINKELAIIEDYKAQIKELEEKIEGHEVVIKAYTKSSENRYGYAKEVREGSIIAKAIEEKVGKEADNALSDLTTELSRALWLSRDIEEALTIYTTYEAKLKDMAEARKDES